MKNTPVFFTVLLLLCFNAATAQVAINTTGNDPHPSAALDVNAPDKGMLIPRVTLNAIGDNQNPVSNPATGLLVYNLGNGSLEPGIYQWNGERWSALATIEQVQNVVHGPLSAGIYGEIYEYSEIGSFSELDINQANSYSTWATGSEGDISSMTFSNGMITIQNPGMYSVSFTSIQQTSSGGKIVDAALFVNNIRQDDMHGRVWFKEGNKSQDISFSGLIDLDESDQVSVGFTMNNSGTIKIEMANLNLTRLN